MRVALDYSTSGSVTYYVTRNCAGKKANVDRPYYKNIQSYMGLLVGIGLQATSCNKSSCRWGKSRPEFNGHSRNMA